MLHINGLSKKYHTLDGEVTALDSISLNIHKGDFVAIVGKSGSGKTTLLNMIGGLDIPDSGSIIFEGTDITKLSEKRAAELRRRKIGIIYQFYNLIPELTASENITLPVELDGGKIDKGRLSEIMSVVGMIGRAQAYPDTLSGGQQQRVAIARALFNNPALILADEPTGNLDNENSDEIMRLLKILNDEQDVTVLVVTHSAAVADRAERVITLSNGKIVSDRRQ